jgi:hypothetical protein
MAEEPKVDQSVMISLDNLLSDDGDLGGLSKDEGPKAPKGVNLAALGQVGVTQSSEYRPPINAPVVQRLEFNEPKRSGFMNYVLLTLTGVALVGGGIFLGNRFMLPTPVVEAPPQGSAVNTPPAPSPAAPLGSAPQALTPPPPPAQPAAVTSAEEEAVSKGAPQLAVAKVVSKPKNSSKADPKADPKADVKAEPAPAPPPEPTPEPKPEPKRSEAASILSALKSPKGATPAPASPAAPAAGGVKERLDRDDILSTVRKNQAAVNQCKPMVKAPGTRVEVRLVIEPSGSVSAVSLLAPEEYKGSPLEGCMKERVGRFSFPKFSSSPMSIKLPFIL